MKGIILLLGLFSFSSIVIREKIKDKPDKSITKRQLIRDYEIFQSIMERANSGLYKYHTKVEIDSSFLHNKNQINNTTTYREFYILLWETFDYSGSCHNSLNFYSKLADRVEAKPFFFPLPLKRLDRTLYSNIEYENIPLGSEIISVNGVSAVDFLNKVSKYTSSDGHNLTGKYSFIETDWFPFNTYIAFGGQSHFIIEYKVSGTLKKTTIKSVKYSTCIDLYNERHSKIFERRNKDNYSFKYLDSLNAGLLTVKTFSLGGPKSKRHAIYKQFLDSIFLELNSNQVPNIIVDIRGNGGGQDPNDLLLYSYLTQRNFRENKTAFTIFNRVPYPRYFAPDYFGEKWSLRRELKDEHNHLIDGKYYQDSTYNLVWKPNKNAYKGRVILLIDPFVASAASLFGCMVKSDTNTIVVGEESCGGYHGHTGHIPVGYKLPHTKISFSFSIVDLEQDVEQLPDEIYGDGIVPDIKVIQTFADFLNQKDTQLDYVLNMLKREN